MDCATCHHLEAVVSKASRDWAFAEQLAEVSGWMPELAKPARRKAESARKEYDLAVRALAEHHEQCHAFKSRDANGAGGVS
ncbi:MAG: hypothetical protein ROO76_07405 [Terriglobia bacterium]|nr:hypothetical protein [Terriglobia bacterium]